LRCDGVKYLHREFDALIIKKNEKLAGDLSEPGESRPMKVVSPVEAPLKSWPPSNSEIAE
jgi:hypothetical protein